MEFLKLLLYISLTIAITVRANENSESDSENRATRYPYDVKPVLYRINLMTDISESNVSFHGEYNVSFDVNIATQRIRLLLTAMELDESATRLFTPDNETYRPINYTYEKETATVVLNFEKELLPGDYAMSVGYSGNSPINSEEFTSSSYKSEEGGRLWIATMPFTPIMVAGLPFLPCWGKPALTHSFFISVRHHRSFIALSNGMTNRRGDSGNDMVWTSFRTLHVMSTCQVAVVLTDYVQARNASNITLWSRSNMTPIMKYAQSVVEKVWDFMAEYTGVPEKTVKIDHIAVTTWPHPATAYWGFTFYSESDLVYDETKEPTYNRKLVAQLLAHETSHQWFGCMISPTDILYRWLSEGIASFYEMYITDKLNKDWRVEDFMVVDIMHESLNEDVSLAMDPITSYPPDQAAENLSGVELYSLYNKAPAVLRMLQHVLTDNIFRIGIMRYLRNNLLDSASPDDLWSAMQSALNESSFVLHENYTVKEMMDTWTDQRHYPLVTVKRNYRTDFTEITQNSFLEEGNENDTDNKWWVPVTWATQTDFDFGDTMPLRWLTPSEPSINFRVNRSEWVIVNIQQMGYYRVNYDYDNWRRIIRYLKCGDYMRIHVLNRAQLLDDAFALVNRRRIDSSIFYELTGNYLTKETDYVVWYVTCRNLVRLTKYFPLPESQLFKAHMAAVFDQIVKIVRDEENPNDDDVTKLRRIKVLKWACIVGNIECKRMANEKLNYHLNFNTTNKILNWWKDWTYCSGLMTADRTTWDKMMNLYMQNRDKKFLEYLTCSEDSDIIINYLNIIASNNSILQETDRDLTFKDIIIKHARDEPVLDYMLQNLERIKPESFTKSMALKDIVSNIYSESQLDKIKNFVKNNQNEMVSTMVIPTIDSRLAAVKNLVFSFGWYSNRKIQGQALLSPMIRINQQYYMCDGRMEH